MYHLTPPPDASVAPIQLGPTADPVVAVMDGAEIASWPRRLAAYIVDVAIVMAIAAALAYFGYTWSGLAGRYVGLFILVAYMTVMQVFTHHTIGKYILGIQVVNEYAPAMVPSFGRILVREIGGRLLGWLGYLFHIRDPKRQGWNDLMADTIVISRPVNSSVQISLIAAVAVSVIAAVAVFGPRTVERQRKASEIGRMIAVEGANADRLMRQIDSLRGGRISFEQLQQNNEQVLPLLNEYENSVRHLQSLTASALNQKLVAPDKIDAIRTLQALCSTMLEVAEVERAQANAIVGYRPGQPLRALQAELQPLSVRFAQLQATLAREKVGDPLRNQSRPLN